MGIGMSASTASIGTKPAESYEAAYLRSVIDVEPLGLVQR